MRWSVGAPPPLPPQLRFASLPFAAGVRPASGLLPPSIAALPRPHCHPTADDPASVAPKSGAQPMEEGGVPASPSAASSQATQQLPARQGQQQQQQQSAQSAPPPAGRQTAAPASPRLPAVANACPPFGSKSVIGRRAKMEDACVAVPYLVEVPVSRAGMDELLPPRIAPQLRTLSAGSGASEQTAAAAAAARAEVYAAGSALGSGSQEQQQQRQQASSGGGVFAMAVDPADTTSGALSGGPATETLHFFGVFDGHGGADAALHCARSLHERVRDVLSACSHPAADLLTLRSSKDAAAPQASSSGGTGEQPRQQGASSSEDYRDATAAGGCQGWLVKGRQAMSTCSTVKIHACLHGANPCVARHAPFPALLCLPWCLKPPLPLLIATQQLRTLAAAQAATWTPILTRLRLRKRPIVYRACSAQQKQ